MKALTVAIAVGCLHVAHAYDYVVIGGGTAGLAVASRLAEDSAIQVAVIEAGTNAEDLPEVYIPGLVGTGQAFTTLNWAYATVPQVNLNNRTLTVNGGKALGGSTVINGMIFPRAEKEQYDVWGALNGNDSSWTWDSLLPFFKKSEKFEPPNEFQTSNGASYEPEVHGTSGRVKVGFPNFFFPQSTLWRNTSATLGLPALQDLDDGEPHGTAVTPVSIDAANNTRCSAACAYYTPFANKSNFVVMTNATVTRILWANSTDGDALIATGVEFVMNNQTMTANATREVIVSAGTIGTPKVMELSGVGNSTILRAAGIEPVLEHPTIGENLADHVHSWVNTYTTPETLTKDAALLNAKFSQQQLDLWYENRTGLWSGIVGPGSLGLAAPSNIFTQSQLSDLVSEAQANLTFYAEKFSNGNTHLTKGIEAQHQLMLQLYQSDKQLPLEINFMPEYQGPDSFSARPARNYSTVSNVLYSPLSRGRTHISSSDYLSPPAVDPAYWSHPLDIAAHVAGITLARKMLTSEPLNSIYDGEYSPGSNITTDAEIEEFLRGNAASDNHEVGTMAMLPQSLGGVVDTSLKVYGIANVRVVDASIIPLPVSAHMSSTVYMIGERGADLIKQDQRGA